MPEVQNVGMSNFYLGQFVEQDHGVYPPGGNMTTSIDAQNISTDEHFVKANGIQLMSGRDFRLGDSARVLINETLCRRLGLKPETAPGTKIYSEYKPDPMIVMEIVGVMKDFNYSSLHKEIKPLELDYQGDINYLDKITVAVNSDNYKSVLAKMEAAWHKNLPGVPFEYQFLDDVVQKQYESEVTLGNIINSFTLMAILISSLRTVRPRFFQRRTKKQRDRHPKSIGCKCFRYRAAFIERLSKTGPDFFYHRNTHRVVGNE